MNNLRLTELMESHGLDNTQVANMLSISPHTVRNWTRPITTKGYRSMPDLAIKALETNIAIAHLLELEMPISTDDREDHES